MTPAGWRARFAAVHTDAEIVAMAADFVASFPPGELQQLSCAPPPLASAEDVSNYAYVLVRSNCEGDARVAMMVRRFVAFFSEASIRLGELRPRPESARRDDRRPA